MGCQHNCLGGTQTWTNSTPATHSRASQSVRLSVCLSVCFSTPCQSLTARRGFSNWINTIFFARVAVVFFLCISKWPGRERPLLVLVLVSAALGKPLNYEIIKILVPDTDAFINTILLMGLPQCWQSPKLILISAQPTKWPGYICGCIAPFLLPTARDTMLISICKVVSAVFTPWDPSRCGRGSCPFCRFDY